MDERIEVPTTIKPLPVSLAEATAALAENISQSEPILHFRDSERKLHADNEAMQLMADFVELQKKIRDQHSLGVISESDIKRLRDYQMAISANNLIQQHTLALQEANDFLKEINMEISNLLGIDFASLTRRGSGCC